MVRLIAGTITTACRCATSSARILSSPTGTLTGRGQCRSICPSAGQGASARQNDQPRTTTNIRRTPLAERFRRSYRSRSQPWKRLRSFLIANNSRYRLTVNMLRIGPYADCQCQRGSEPAGSFELPEGPRLQPYDHHQTWCRRPRQHRIHSLSPGHGSHGGLGRSTNAAGFRSTQWTTPLPTLIDRYSMVWSGFAARARP